MKVSPDGASWFDALVVDRTTGRVTLSQGFAVPPAPFDAMAPLNMALNGDHVVSQEKIDAAVTSIGASGGVATYVTDQWAIRAKGSLRVSGQRITSLSLPGFKYALRTTITTAQSSLGSADYVQVSQPIEGGRALKLAFGTAGAFAVSVGVYVRSSVTGTFAVTLTNSARDRSICKPFTIATANTWTWVALAGSPSTGATAFPGDTSGTWLTDNGAGLRIGITLAAGLAMVGTADAWAGADVLSTSAQTNLAATSSATFDVSGLVVLAGTDLPSASRAPLIVRPFGDEILLCKRHWQKCWDHDTAVGNTAEAQLIQFDWGGNNTGSIAGGTWSFAPSMRTAPTMTVYDAAGNAGKVSVLGTTATRTDNTTVTSQVLANESHYHLRMYGDGKAGVIFGFTADARLSA